MRFIFQDIPRTQWSSLSKVWCDVFLQWGIVMERLANLHIEKLPEGVYLATSDDIPGLIAQGRTISETVEIARDVARKLLEAQSERSSMVDLAILGDAFDYPLIVGG